jgi:hypothetical protein
MYRRPIVAAMLGMVIGVISTGLVLYGLFIYLMWGGWP